VAGAAATRRARGRPSRAKLQRGLPGGQIGEGDVALPPGDQLEPFADADDIAEVAAAALTDDRDIGELYELTSPRLTTLADGVGEIATATVRDIHDVPISVEECAASADDHGALVPLEEQDRGLWDGDAIGEATTLLDAALRRGQPGPNQLRGAAPPATPPAPTAPRPTDWRQIALPYAQLSRMRTPGRGPQPGGRRGRGRRPALGLELVDRPERDPVTSLATTCWLPSAPTCSVDFGRHPKRPTPTAWLLRSHPPTRSVSIRPTWPTPLPPSDGGDFFVPACPSEPAAFVDTAKGPATGCPSVHSRSEACP
jgi:hypothetical protein